jgi:hypothetical protein
MIPANTRKQLGQLSDLYVNAYALIQKGVRSDRSIHELLKALQLFKEEKLEGVVLPLPSGDKPSPVERRAEFVRRLADEGGDVLFREFTERLTGFARNRLAERDISSFRVLVSYGRRYFSRGRSVGEHTLEQLEKALAEYGLYLDMSEKEVENVFGPSSPD